MRNKDSELVNVKVRERTICMYQCQVIKLIRSDSQLDLEMFLELWWQTPPEELAHDVFKGMAKTGGTFPLQLST